jgi:hypothetical protein
MDFHFVNTNNGANMHLNLTDQVGLPHRESNVVMLNGVKQSTSDKYLAFSETNLDVLNKQMVAPFPVRVQQPTIMLPKIEVSTQKKGNKVKSHSKFYTGKFSEYNVNS